MLGYDGGNRSTPQRVCWLASGPIPTAGGQETRRGASQGQNQPRRAWRGDHDGESNSDTSSKEMGERNRSIPDATPKPLFSLSTLTNNEAKLLYRLKIITLQTHPVKTKNKKPKTDGEGTE